MMQNIDALRSRVGKTTDELIRFQAERQDQSQNLVDVLAQLEEKFSAQKSELAFYRKRLSPLEAANGQLASLIENLLDLIERGFGEDGLRPLRRASEMAASLLSAEINQDGAIIDAVDTPAAIEADSEATSVAEAIVAAAALEQAVAADPAFDEPASVEVPAVSEFEPGVVFEDVRDAVLELENEEENFDDNDHWTQVVFEAAGIPLPANNSEREEADPVSEDDDNPVPGGAADIQALLKRVEALASEMDAGDAVIGNPSKFDSEAVPEPLLRAGNGG